MRVRTTTVIAATTGLLAATLVVSSSSAEDGDAGGPALQQALQKTETDLTTPFEDSDGAQWTSVRESIRFNRELASVSDRVAYGVAGRSVEGRPLQLVSVGEPEPMGKAEAADGSVAMFNCSIHGDEPAGREGCMQLARDLAESDTPAVERMLRHTTVLFLYSNPDGWQANTRENADGFDINRDMMALATPEGRAIARTIRDWKPDVLNDLHEYGASKYYEDHALQLWPRNRNVDGTIHELSMSMVHDYAAPQVETNEGYTAGIYGVLVKDGEPFQQIAGDHQARILRNYTGLQHVTGMLTETADNALTPEEEADPALRNRRRAQVEYSSAVGTLEMVREHRGRLAAESAAAAERATQAGADQSGVVYFAGQDNMLPTEDDGAEPEPMCGYQLTAGQFDSVRRTLRLHGIGWERNADGAMVSMAQPDKTLIPLLLDERSEYGLTQATPLQTC